MPEADNPLPRLRHSAALVAAALRKDLVKILAVAVVAAGAGGAAGNFSTSVSATAQLVLTPLPMRDNYWIEKDEQQYAPEDIGLVRMVPAPLHAKTAVILCTSDDTLRRTMERANAPGILSSPLGSLNATRGALATEISTEMETPYEIRHSPIIKLRATAKAPLDAQALANAWAAECIEAARSFQAARAKTAVTELERESARLADFAKAGKSVDNVVVADLNAKLEYARIAAGLNEGPLQLLSPAGEWTMPGSRRAMTFAAAGALWGLVLAAALSIGFRAVLAPAPKSA